MQTERTSSVLYTLRQAACCKQPAPAGQFKFWSALRTEAYKNFPAQKLCRVRVFQQCDKGKCMVAKRTRLSEEVIAPSSNGAVPLSGSGVEAKQQDGERCDCGGSLLHHTRHSATAVICRGHLHLRTLPSGAKVSQCTNCMAHGSRDNSKLDPSHVCIFWFGPWDC